MGIAALPGPRATTNSPAPSSPKWRCAGITTRRRVPLRAPQARRPPYDQRQRDGGCRAGGCRPRRYPDHPARHPLPSRRNGRRPSPLPLSPQQVRFGDESLRVASPPRQAPGSATARIGAAIHSLRAVDPSLLPAFADLVPGGPIHAHVSEQPAENDQVTAAYGRTPTRLFADAGLLGPRFTAVHGTHLTGDDIALLGDSGSSVCLCPTTERDLADGIGPALELQRAGAQLCRAPTRTRHRHVRGAARPGNGPAARHRPARQLHPRRTAGRRRRTATRRSAGPTAVRSPPARLCDLVATATTSRRTAGAALDQLGSPQERRKSPPWWSADPRW